MLEETRRPQLARDHLARAAASCEEALRQHLATLQRAGAPDRLLAAMAHSLLAGGKRLRPALCLAAAELVGGDRAAVLPAAAALELVHTYSLIHDDLPAMDDDVLRRGRPTCHVVFGEGTAILAGDALLTEAFGLLALARVDGALVRRAIIELAAAAGAAGMAGGQQLDLEGSAPAAGPPTLEQVTRLHEGKTAALLRAALVVGAVLGAAPPEDVAALGRYGLALGLAFQVTDDLLDELGSADQLGKSTGKDRAQHKATAVAVLGVPGARQRAATLAASAHAALAGFGGQPLAEVLHGYVELMLERQR